MTIRLLGPPAAVDAGGDPIRVRGHKVWAVLARVLSSDRPVSRTQIAGDLFSDTADPLGSVRWTLAQLRRLVDSGEAFTGDPVSPRIPADVRIDLVDLLSGRMPHDIESIGVLLEGCDPRGAPGFETWLLLERERLAAMTDAVMRQEALGALSRRDHDRALAIGRRLTMRQPFDEGAHVVFVRALVAAGLQDAASDHVERVERRFEEELGAVPTAALRSAARDGVAEPPPGVSPAANVGALIESGRAALDAGAVDAGIACLRRAVAESERVAASHVRAGALVELGSALIHTIRGHDDEGSILMREAVDVGRQVGDARSAAIALRELAYVDALVGRRPTAARLIEEARDAADDDFLRSGVEAIDAFNLTEWGRFDEGIARYEDSIELARSAGHVRQEAWSLGLGARAHLLAGDDAGAREWARSSASIAAEAQWLSFRPWPASIGAELDLRAGAEADEVSRAMEQSFSLSCQLGDPCWEGSTARVLALCHDTMERSGEALRWIEEARTRVTRHTDSYAGVVGSVLATEADLALRAGDEERAAIVARQLLSLAARTHQDHFVDRAVGLLGR